MRLKTVSHSLFMGVMLALMANFAFLVLIRSAYDTSALAALEREQTVRAVEQLRHETELLRRLVRAYTATGDANYLLTYYDIYAIRQGEKAAPPDADPSVFWEEVIARRRPHALPEDGLRQNLVQRMKGLNVSADELAGLQSVLDATDRLKKTEQVAFAATQGLYDAEHHAFVSEGVPNLAYATQLVHSKQYEQDGAELTRAIADLARRADARTEAAVEAASTRVSRFIGMAVAVDFGLLPVMGAALMVVRRRVLKPIDTLSSKARSFASGVYSHRGDLEAQAVEEVRTLSTTMDAMAQSIQDDLAARTQVQADLRAARDQAEAATRAKSLFLANMSHEIRTPMNAIIGMTHLALQTPLTDQQQDYLDKVHSASQILLGVINDILDFSKIEAGRLTLESAPYRVEEAVGSALMLVRQKAQEKELELLCEFTDAALLGEAGVVRGDMLRVGQILTNLLSNAVKFTHSGHVKIRVGLDGRQGSTAMLRFEIIDTGIGLNREQRSRLFQEFTQADDSTTRRYGGTGLGLSICQRLTALMGGTIAVDSEYGAGSTFTVTLPVTILPDAAPPHTPLPIEALRVLVVDDQSETRTSLAGLLHALGVGASGRVAVAENGLQALAMVETAAAAGEPFDVMLLDWVLPDIGGADVTARLRHSHPEMDVIVISAYGWDSLQANAKAAGADDFLAKPILPGAVRALFGRLTGIDTSTSGPMPLQEQAIRLDGMRALLVEDNALNQQLAIELLTRRGAIVKSVNNGCEAVEHLRMAGPSAYDLVLMDLHMPMMDGHEATRQIRADDRFRFLPILAMTAHALPEERDRCLAVGMQDHISKPLEPHKLYATLARYHPHYRAGMPVHTAESSPPPSATAPALPLPEVPGLETQQALHRLDGDHVLYLRVLAAWADHLDEARATLLAAVEASEIDAAQWAVLEREAHTLRGLCGTVGAHDLARLNADMEQAVRGRDPAQTRAAAQALVLSFQPMLASLRPQLAAAASRPQRWTAAEISAGAVPRSAAQDMAQVMQRLLKDCDSEAIQLWQLQREVFKAQVAPLAFTRLDAAIEACDFDAALRLIQEALGHAQA